MTAASKPVPAQSATASQEWVRVSEALPLLDGVFHSFGALRYHLHNRGVNGMLRAAAVRETPLGLRIHPQRMIAWARGQKPPT